MLKTQLFVPLQSYFVTTAMNLKKQTTISLAWNGLNKVGYQAMALVVGIITARLLSPTDFGYIAALAMFTMLSNILVESGFTAALVRREKNTPAEYSAAFIFNVLISALFYIVLFFAAPTIADYFKMPPLKDLARVIFLAIILNAFSIIPNIILTKELKFKEIAIAELTGMFCSSIITITMAMMSFGYWAIAAQQLSQICVKVLILWYFSKWRPQASCSFGVIREIFSFSTVLILASLVSTAVKYAYNFFIGPRYSSTDLGYYGQAYKFHQIPPTVIGSTITGVSYPVLSSLNAEKERQMLYIEKILKATAFLTFPTMIGLYAVAPNFITVILTNKWMPMLPYFKILIVAGITIPFYTLNANVLNAIGLPKTNFTIDIIRNALVVFFLLVMNSSIIMILTGYLISYWVSLIISSIAIQRHTGYTFLQQLIHVLPSLIISIVMGLTVMAIDRQVHASVNTRFVLQLTIGTGLYIALAWGLKLNIMNDITDIAKNKFNK